MFNALLFYVLMLTHILSLYLRIWGKDAVLGNIRYYVGITQYAVVLHVGYIMHNIITWDVWDVLHIMLCISLGTQYLVSNASHVLRSSVLHMMCRICRYYILHIA